MPLSLPHSRAGLSDLSHSWSLPTLLESPCHRASPTSPLGDMHSPLSCKSWSSGKSPSHRKSKELCESPTSLPKLRRSVEAKESVLHDQDTAIQKDDIEKEKLGDVVSPGNTFAASPKETGSDVCEPASPPRRPDSRGKHHKLLAPFRNGALGIPSAHAAPRYQKQRELPTMVTPPPSPVSRRMHHRRSPEGKKLRATKNASTPCIQSPTHVDSPCRRSLKSLASSKERGRCDKMGDSKRCEQESAKNGENTLLEICETPASVGGKTATASGNKAASVDELCGFKLGQIVRTDAEGPWKGMGDAKIIGPGPKKGFLNVRFATDASLDGIFPIRASYLKTVEPESSANTEPESHMKRFGLTSGDAVVWQKEARGIVTGPGSSPWNASVKFAGIGIKSVPLDQLKKVVFRSLSKGGVQQSQEQIAALWAGVDLPEAASATTLSNGLKAGSCVKAKEGRWKGMGIGVVEAVSQTSGMACVKFNIMGERWMLNANDLVPMEDPGFCMTHVRQDFERRRDHLA